MYGNWGRILIVDLTHRSWDVESVPEDAYRRFIGGSGLAAWWFVEHECWKADPLGPDNLLGVYAGRLECHVEAVTLDQTLDELSDRFGDAFTRTLGTAIVLVNGRRVFADSIDPVPLRPGDTIELIPMIAGG